MSKVIKVNNTIFEIYGDDPEILLDEKIGMAYDALPITKRLVGQFFFYNGPSFRGNNTLLAHGKDGIVYEYFDPPVYKMDQSRGIWMSEMRADGDVSILTPGDWIGNSFYNLKQYTLIGEGLK